MQKESLPAFVCHREELVGGMATQKTLKKDAAQVSATIVLKSKGVHHALERVELSCLGLKDKRSDLEAVALMMFLGRDALWVTLDTRGSTTDILHNRRFTRSSEVVRVVEQTELPLGP